MKKLIIFSLFIQIIHAQNQFDRVIATGQNNIANIFCPAVIINDTINGFISNNFRNYYGFACSIAQLDVKGNLLSNNTFLDTLNPFDVYDAVNEQNKVLICGAQKVRIDGSRTIMYGLLNQNLDTIWTKIIDSEYNHPAVYKITRLQNGNIAMVGDDTHIRPTGGSYSKKNHAIFILTDSLGNILKYTHFEKPDSNNLEALNYVMQSSTGDIYCIGQNQINTLYNKGLIIKLNQDGEFIWRKEIEQRYYGYDTNFGKELPNGQILIVGSKYLPFFIDSTQVWTSTIIIDSSGNKIKEQYFFSNIGGNNSKCVSDINGSIICTGAVFYSDTSHAKGYLIKLSPTGDSIWKREFTHGWKDRDEVFRNITYASDGGYYLTGYNWVQGDNSSKAWIVKVDSNGCVVAGCNTAVNVEKEVYGSLFHLFPNPASDQLIIYLNDEDLQERSYILNCYDQNGKLVLTREISGRKSDIDLGNLTSGMYFYQIGDGRKVIQSGKLVKM